MAVPLDPKLVQIRSVGKLPGVSHVAPIRYTARSHAFRITYKGVIFILTYYKKPPHHSSPASHGLPYVELTHRSSHVLTGYVAPKYTSRNKVTTTAIHNALKRHYEWLRILKPAQVPKN